MTRKSAIGITIHYDDDTVDKVPIAVVINAVAAQPAGRGNANWINADECPEHGPWKAIASGVSKTTGREYHAFWTCDTEQGAPRCTNKPSRDWIETHPPGGVSSSAPSQRDENFFDDLSF